MPQECELHHCMVMTAPAAFNSDITRQFTWVGEQQVQYSIPPGGAVYYLAQKVTLNIFQELLELPTTHCAFPADVRVIEVPQQYESL